MMVYEQLAIEGRPIFPAGIGFATVDGEQILMRPTALKTTRLA